MSELIKIEEVTITQTGDAFLKDQALMTELLEQNALLKKEIDRLTTESLKASEKYEKLRMQLSTSNMHLFKMLDDRESTFYVEQKFDSPEICREYIDAALYCRKYFGRNNHNLSTPEEAQEWYDNYSLPFPSESVHGIKRGDKVRCISLEQREEESDAWTKKAGMKIGETYTVKEIAFGKPSYILLEGSVYWLPVLNFEKV